jgi:hypothetical protein
MDNPQESRPDKQKRFEKAKTLENNPVAEALFRVLENDESVHTCQFMSELLSLAGEEQES